MNYKDKQIYVARYTSRFKIYGYDPKTLGWGKGGRQKIRFKVLIEIGVKKDSSVLDVGCGFGDLYGFLKEREWKGKYLGIDIVEDLIKEGQKRYPEANLKVGDILENKIGENYDFVISSGIFNAKLKYESNELYIKKMLTEMFNICNIGVATDFMSSYVDFTTEIGYYSDPCKIFKIAKKLTKRVVLRHDYMPYEFCIYLFKDDSICKNNVFRGFR